MTTFMEMLQAKWDEGKFVCVGLDTDTSSPKFPGKVPIHPWVALLDEIDLNLLDDDQQAQLSFNCSIVDTTKDLVLAYKPNLAFYRGAPGKRVLKLTIGYIKQVAPDVVVILDAKQADIGNTNDGYVSEDFEYYEADAVAVHPYLGMKAMYPFLDQADKGIIVLCRTSNEGAAEFQDRLTFPTWEEEEAWSISPSNSDRKNRRREALPLYLIVAYSVSRNWDYNSNCALVVGATYPVELAEVRRVVGDMPILIPGIGAQGGDLEATVNAGKDSRGQGMIINSSRGIIFASSGKDFAEAAWSATQELHDAITACLTAG